MLISLDSEPKSQKSRITFSWDAMRSKSGRHQHDIGRGRKEETVEAAEPSSIYATFSRQPTTNNSAKRQPIFAQIIHNHRTHIRSVDKSSKMCCKPPKKASR